MADMRRLMAKMSPGTQSWTIGFGAAPGLLTPMDIALAVGHIRDRTAYRLLVYRYGGHDRHSERQRLELAILAEARTLAKQYGWRVSDNRLACVARLWVAEAMHARRCSYCEGTGEIFCREARRHHACQHCGATGVRPWSGRQRAEAIGITPAAYRQTWRHRYALLEQVVSVKEADGLGVFRRAIG